MREYLDKVIKADQCAQYVDDIGIAAENATLLINNLRATFECIKDRGSHNCHVGANEIDFLGRTITPEGGVTTTTQGPKFLRENEISKIRKKTFNDNWVS